MKVSIIKVKGGCQKSFFHLLIITLLLPGTVPQQGTKRSALNSQKPTWSTEKITQTH